MSLTSAVIVTTTTESGNYISSDPIRLSGGERPFGYVGNPMDWMDLFGLAGCKSNTDTLGVHSLLKRNGVKGQSHHLNQDATYRDLIPTDKGAAIKLEGNAFTQPGTPHYEAHKSLEQFWDQYRKGGELYGSRPTNLQYTQALKRSLEATGLPASKVAEAIKYAIHNRVQYGALGGMRVPRIPGRINQVLL